MYGFKTVIGWVEMRSEVQDVACDKEDCHPEAYYLHSSLLNEDERYQDDPSGHHDILVGPLRTGLGFEVLSQDTILARVTFLRESVFSLGFPCHDETLEAKAQSEDRYENEGEGTGHPIAIVGGVPVFDLHDQREEKVDLTGENQPKKGVPLGLNVEPVCELAEFLVLRQ